MSVPADQVAGCDYCGLPLPRGWFHARRRDEPAELTSQPQFCCFGCRLAAEVTRARGEQGATNWTLVRLGLALFFAMNVMVFTMALWSGDVYALGPEGATPLALALDDLFRYLSLLFALPVLFLLGGPLVDDAWRSLREGRPNADLLIVLGVSAAYVYSIVAVIRGSGHVYFEVGAVVLVVVTIGRWLEAQGKLKATASLDALERLLPETVRVETGGRLVERRREDVEAGQRLRIFPGERIAADGVIRRGRAAVDEQIFTGESAPVVKSAGDEVYGGTLNLDGDLLIESTSRCGEGSLGRLQELMRKARQSRGRYQRLADRVSAWFLPAVVVVMAGAIIYHGQRADLATALMTGLAVLLIACPCALGLATPLAVWTALATAARAQVLFRNGEALERLAAIRAVRFDKTGTLTTGQPLVERLEVDEPSRRGDVAQRAAALAALSDHTLSRAVGQFAASCSLPLVTEATHVAGRGITARWPADGQLVTLGSPLLMDELAMSFPNRLSEVDRDAERGGSPRCCVAWGGRVRGVFLFREAPRPEAREALARLVALGLDVAVLTGDSAGRAAALAERFGIPVAAGLLPVDKVAAIRALADTHVSVAMVGDGLNDAPALSAADVGIALGCGSDVSRDAAAVCLLSNDLARIPWAIHLSRRAVRIIKQNLFWAFGYNTAGVALAAGGWLNPVLAALLMVASSLLVIGNSLRLSALAPPDAAPVPSAARRAATTVPPLAASQETGPPHELQGQLPG